MLIIGITVIGRYTYNKTPIVHHERTRVSGDVSRGQQTTHDYHLVLVTQARVYFINTSRRRVNEEPAETTLIVEIIFFEAVSASVKRTTSRVKTQLRHVCHSSDRRERQKKYTIGTYVTSGSAYFSDLFD